jgi:hypothetical protein
MSGYAAIGDRIEGLPDQTRDLLRQYLAFLTLTVPRPTKQLATCSEPVFDAICVQARARLERGPADHHLGARLFQTRYQLLGSRASRARLLEENVLVPTLPRWSRRDRGQVQNILKREAVPREQRLRDLSRDFKLWCKKNARTGNSRPAAVTSGGSVITRISSRLRPGPR